MPSNEPLLFFITKGGAVFVPMTNSRLRGCSGVEFCKTAIGSSCAGICAIVVAQTRTDIKARRIACENILNEEGLILRLFVFNIVFLKVVELCFIAGMHG